MRRGATVASLILLGLILAVAAACSDSEANGKAPSASISADQARQAAVAAVPGTVQQVRLEREDGHAIYEVTVQPQTGGAAMDVQVDGNDGTVLKTEPASEREDDDGD